jgi:hypothetical protein
VAALARPLDHQLADPAGSSGHRHLHCICPFS